MRFATSFAFTVLATPALTAPNVVVDIAPLHGLVSEVMAGVAAPVLLLPPQADAHSYALRPSDAQTLSDADLVIWVGEGLTPWLSDPLATLAADASRLEMLDTDGWDAREIDDAHDDDHGAHDHGAVDPHAWMDPQVASVWVGHIAAQLSQADPENAQAYLANAATLQAELDVMRSEITAQLAPFAARPLIWPHDAYGYFQDAFALTALGAISEVDAAAAGPQHIADLRDAVLSQGVVCVLSDPEVNPRWSTILREGTDAKAAMIDGIGADIPTGLGQYQTLIANLADNIAGCLTP